MDAAMIIGLLVTGWFLAGTILGLREIGDDVPAITATISGVKGADSVSAIFSPAFTHVVRLCLAAASGDASIVTNAKFLPSDGSGAAFLLLGSITIGLLTWLLLVFLAAIIVPNTGTPLMILESGFVIPPPLFWIAQGLFLISILVSNLELGLLLLGLILFGFFCLVSYNKKVRRLTLSEASLPLFFGSFASCAFVDIGFAGSVAILITLLIFLARKAGVA